MSRESWEKGCGNTGAGTGSGTGYSTAENPSEVDERKAEVIRLRELVKEKKAKGIVVSKKAALPNLRDVEKHSH
jgi:hypothetical protein